VLAKFDTFDMKIRSSLTTALLLMLVCDIAWGTSPGGGGASGGGASGGGASGGGASGGGGGGGSGGTSSGDSGGGPAPPGPGGGDSGEKSKGPPKLPDTDFVQLSTTISFITSYTEEQWTTNVSTVYENAYGKVLGIYDIGTGFSQECSVFSMVETSDSSRRAPLAVQFTATFLDIFKYEAENAAYTLGPAMIVDAAAAVGQYLNNTVTLASASDMVLSATKLDGVALVAPHPPAQWSGLVEDQVLAIALSVSFCVIAAVAISVYCILLQRQAQLLTEEEESQDVLMNLSKFDARGSGFAT